MLEISRASSSLNTGTALLLCMVPMPLILVPVYILSGGRAATAPGVSGQPAPATPATAPATQGADEFGTEAPQPQLSAQSQQALAGQLTPQQIRQQGRFDQRLARQARRNTRRAGQQEQ
jgi:hypothetical protein